MAQAKHRYTPQDREDSIYQYIPFEVPAGADGITVSYKFSGFSSVIDLGIFDPVGFRGWTGSSRSVAMISPSKATPGYLPGPIRAGTWLVALGLHQVEKSGTEVEVTWEIGKPDFPAIPPRGPRAERPARRTLPSRAGYRWFPADFHTHSEHSDGSLSILDLVGLAAGRGLEILAVTDHNTTSHHPYLSDAAKYHGINVIAGQEVTTNTGHANAFGEIEWVDFRQATQSWLDETASRDGLLSINHPLAGFCSWFRDIPQGIPLTEIWHSSWDRISDDPIEWWRENGAIPIGGSDFHRLGADGLPGEPTTWIEIQTDDDDVSQPQILEALAAGRITISGDINDPVIVPIDDHLVVDGGEGCTLRAPDGTLTKITSSSQRVKASSGLYTLSQADGLYQSLCYQL